VVAWYKDGLEIQLVLQSKFVLKGNDLIIEDIVEDDFGVYKCTAENYLNSTEQVFHLFVNVPPVIVVHPTAIHFESILTPDNQGYYRDSNNFFYLRNLLPAVFRCDVSGYPKPSVYWKKDGELLSTPTTKMNWLIINNVTVSDEGNYSCFAINSYGITQSRSASLSIGNVWPCCFSTEIWSDSSGQAGSTMHTWILLHSISSSYTVSNVTVTKDGYHFKSSRQVFHYTIVTLRPTDIGVYGYHVVLSSLSSNSTHLTVSFYLPLVAKASPRISIRPSNIIVQDFDKPFYAFCLAYSFLSFPNISWSEDNVPLHGQWKVISGARFTTAYLNVSNTPDTLRHYTCEVRNSVGLTSRATISVVLRAEAGGWSWWMESLPCSVTCGKIPGIRLRSRRCYNDSSRCAGDSIQIRSCYSSLLQCPSETNIIYSSPTPTANLRSTEISTTVSTTEIQVTSTTSKRQTTSSTSKRQITTSKRQATSTTSKRQITSTTSTIASKTAGIIDVRSSDAIAVVAKSELSQGEIGLSVSLSVFVSICLTVFVMWLIRRLRRKARDNDTMTNAGTAANTYASPSPSFPRGQTTKTQIHHPLPAVAHPACYLEMGTKKNDEADGGEGLAAYYYVPSAEAPTEDPIYAETLY
jgi:hypothetical protein